MFQQHSFHCPLSLKNLQSTPWSRCESSDQDPSKSFNYFQPTSAWLLHALDIWGQCLLFLPSYLLNPLLLLLFHKTCIVGQLFLLNLFYALCPSIKAAPNYIYSSKFLYDILYRPQQRYICFFQSYCPALSACSVLNQHATFGASAKIKRYQVSYSWIASLYLFFMICNKSLVFFLFLKETLSIFCVLF